MALAVGAWDGLGFWLEMQTRDPFSQNLNPEGVC